jgi:tetratricopeptide (TPR) repeat protein
MHIYGVASVVGQRLGRRFRRDDLWNRPLRALGRAFIKALAFVWILFALGSACAPAQTAPAPNEADLHAQADVLFKRLLVKPNDLDAAFLYSQIETKLGDYEAAIGALERMLFYNTDLPRVKLELGVLYYRLRSYEMARTYFAAAIAGKETPQDVRDEVATFLVAIDRAVADHQFALFAQFGFRHQSNGNAGPNSQVVEALGQNATLSSQFQRKADWNAFGVTTLHHFYDFGDQNEDGWESDLTAYYARQFKLTNLNLGLLEASTGPRLGLGSDVLKSIHPYGLANVVTLGDAEYFGTIGGGASVRIELPFAIEVNPGVEYRDRQFRNSSPYPTAVLQTGNQWIAYELSSAPIAMIPGLSLQTRVAFTGDTAQYSPYSYRDLSVDAALPYSFAAPVFAHSGANWTVAPFVGYSYTPYQQADPIVDPSVTRLDRQWRVGATLDARFYQNIGFSIQVQYLRTDSTVINYRTSDFIVSGGPTIRF